MNNNNNNNFEINNLDNDNMNIASTCYSEISKFNSESELNDIEDVSLSDFSYAISKQPIRLTNANKYKVLKNKYTIEEDYIFPQPQA